MNAYGVLTDKGRTAQNRPTHSCLSLELKDYLGNPFKEGNLYNLYNGYTFHNNIFHAQELGTPNLVNFKENPTLSRGE